MTRHEERQLDRFWPPVQLSDGRYITSEQQLSPPERRYRGFRRLIKKQLHYFVKRFGDRFAKKLVEILRMKHE